MHKGSIHSYGSGRDDINYTPLTPTWIATIIPQDTLEGVILITIRGSTVVGLLRLLPSTVFARLQPRQVSIARTVAPL